MIKYIASDLDGTILLNDAQQVDREYFDIISQFKKAGIPFIAASGRQYFNMRNLFAPIKDEISYVAENGSLCIHNGKILHMGKIDRDLSCRIFKAIREVPNCTCMLSCPDKIYAETEDSHFWWHLSNVLINDIEKVEDLCALTQPFIKISIYDPTGTEKCYPYFYDLFNDEISVVTSGENWIDFVAPNANKGIGLTKLLNELNIAPEEGIIFGDQQNDCEMLSLTPHSYAMENCAPEAAEAANFRTSCVKEVLKNLLNEI